MNRFWLASRDIYSRTSLLPAGRNSKKPDKAIGTDGKLVADGDASLSAADIVKRIMDGTPGTAVPSHASPYGRTVYIKNHADLRFHPRIPRDSQQYKDIYSERTACERVNDRVLNDYFLQYLMIRGKDHFSFWAMLIGICIHLDARYKAGFLRPV